VSDWLVNAGGSIPLKSAERFRLLSLHFISLGSGSNGNATLVRVADTLLLVDAGFSAKALCDRMSSVGISAEDLTAILISHEHSDHVKGVSVLARKYQIPVWLTRGTFNRLKDVKLPVVDFFHPHASFCIGDAEVSPYPIPHDAAEPCQFVVSDGSRRFAIATDLGFVTPYVRQHLRGVDALLLESNYDGDMLKNGSYPFALRGRIDGRYGHLSNDQAAEFASSVEHAGLQRLYLGHLSENNNTPDCAYTAVANRLQRGGDNVQVLKRAEAGEWFEVA